MTARCRSPRSTRETIRRHEDQQRELIAALLDSTAPPRHDLAYRLHHCQQAREVRRAWHDLRHAAPSVYPYQCRLLACWACRRSIIRRWENDARWRFASAANGACTTVSIVLASTTRIDAARGVVAKARKDLGNMRAAAYQQPGGWRWHSMQIFGIVSVDVVALDNAVPLTHDRSTSIPSFPMVEPADSTLWLLRANLAIHHAHLECAEMIRAVTRQWSGLGRVSVRAFSELQSAADNATAIVGGVVERFEQDGWPARPRAEFQGWLFGLRRGLQPIGISSRQRPEKDVLCAEVIKDFIVENARKGDEIEPMPVLF